MNRFQLLTPLSASDRDIELLNLVLFVETSGRPSSGLRPCDYLRAPKITAPVARRERERAPEGKGMSQLRFEEGFLRAFQGLDHQDPTPLKGMVPA